MSRPRTRKTAQTPEDVQQRLESLRLMLEGEGLYTRANTVVLAQQMIGDLTGVWPRELPDPGPAPAADSA